MNTHKKHKQPIDDSESQYLKRCLENKSINGGIALDLACGYGRHTNILKLNNFFVISADFSIESLKLIKEKYKSSTCICLDAQNELPFNDNTFDLIVIVHYVGKNLLTRITRLLKPEGHLIYETFGGQGENWRFLPQKGELDEELKKEFILINKIERQVVKQFDKYANVKLFAKKHI